jgi:lipoate-protein ligase A
MAKPTSGADECPKPEHTVAANWDFLGFSQANGHAQMERDRSLLAEIHSGKRTRPALRFYVFSPPAVSYGHNQNEPDSIQVETAVKLGYDIVQRPTGGRALLHKGDLCYAVVARREWHPEFRTLSCTYRAIAEAHRLTLAKLGVNAVESAEAASKPVSGASPCFAMLNPFEVTVAGRKICGSAQLRAAGAFLQHGSLRVQDNWSESDLTELWPPGLGLSSATVVSLETALTSKIEIIDVVTAWINAFSEVFQVELLSG